MTVFDRRAGTAQSASLITLYQFRTTAVAPRLRLQRRVGQVFPVSNLSSPGLSKRPDWALGLDALPTVSSGVKLFASGLRRGPQY